MYTIIRYPTGAYGLYSPDGFLHIHRTMPGILRWVDILRINRRRLAFRYYRHFRGRGGRRERGQADEACLPPCRSRSIPL